MSRLLPVASGEHRVLTPLAHEIHEAVWDGVGLAKVQEFVAQWAGDYHKRSKAAQAAREKAQKECDRLQQVCDDAVAAGKDAAAVGREVRRAWPNIPELPRLPLPPEHRVRSLAEKWAALAAVHDVFYQGEKVLPWPEPDDQDLVAGAAWLGSDARGYLALTERAGRLTDADARYVKRWLTEVAGGTPAVKPAESEQDQVTQDPEKTPVAESKQVKLFAQKDPPLIDGRPKSPLTKARYDVVRLLIDAGSEGLTKDGLASKHGGAVNTLKALARSDLDWQSVIKLPGKAGIRYRIE